MGASLSGRSGGHPIGIVLLEQDIPDVRRRKKDRRKTNFYKKIFKVEEKVERNKMKSSFPCANIRLLFRYWRIEYCYSLLD